MREQMKAFYLEYVNDWLTVSAMADYHDISLNDCLAFIEAGRDYYFADCDNHFATLKNANRRSIYA